MTLPDLPALAGWFLAGGVLAAAYLDLIRRSVAALTGTGARGAAMGWLLLRVVLAAALFAGAARQGAGPLLTVLAGFLAVRTVLLARGREG